MNTPADDRTSIDNLVAAMGLQSSEFESRKNFAQFTNEDAQILKEISAPVRQQSIGVDQVATAMNEINNVTQQFLSSANQIKVAVAGLSIEVKKLRDKD